jgi:peptidoglycan/xylan/chitin deacetylase (PgdA/CDA1 family)
VFQLKTRRILALSVSLVILAGLLSFIAVPGALASQGTSAVPTQFRGVGFLYMFSASPGATTSNIWSSGYNHEGSNFVEFDVRNDGVYSLNVTWTRNDTMWIVDNTRIHILRPTGAGSQAKPISLESLTITSGSNVRVAASNRSFNNSGSVWVNTAGTYFGNVSIPTVGDWGGNSAYTMGSAAITDVAGTNTVVFPNPNGYTVTYGASRSMGEIRTGDVVTATFRVGERPIPQYGRITGQGTAQNPIITAADTTMLRRYLAAVDKPAFEAAHPTTFIKANADVNGDNVITAADVTLLRQYLAATDPSQVHLGPPLPRYFICLTYDDGPREGSGGDTPGTLNAFRDANNRNTSTIKVVCGRNGVDPCGIPGGRTGCGLGRGTGANACGNTSRAQGSFMVMGNDGLTIPNSAMYLRRILEEGHSLDNHTQNHNIQSNSDVRTQINTVENTINTQVNGVTDFYGNTYNASNRHRSFAFRPNNFRMRSDYTGIDRDFNMPWIFASCDPDDWRGHSGTVMSQYVLNGNMACGGGGPGGNCGGTSFPSGPWQCSIQNTPWAGSQDGAADGVFVLFHDGGGWPRAHTTAATASLIPALQAIGYHLVTIEQMFHYMNAEPQWIPNNPTAGDGTGTRVNDKAIRDNGNYAAWRATVPAPQRVFRP